MWRHRLIWLSISSRTAPSDGSPRTSRSATFSSVENSAAPLGAAQSSTICRRILLATAAARDEGFSCGFCFEAGVGQLLEAACIVDGLVAQLLQRIATQCGAAAGAAVDQDGLVLLKRRIVERALGIGPKFQHTA